MWRTRTGATRVGVELAAASLLLGTAVSDALGHPSASFYLLVAGVPIAAAAGLVAFARIVDSVDGGRVHAFGRLQAVLSALLVAAIVLGAAAREPAIREGSVPAEATAALAFGVILLVLQALVALVPIRR